MEYTIPIYRCTNYNYTTFTLKTDFKSSHTFQPYVARSKHGWRAGKVNDLELTAARNMIFSAGTRAPRNSAHNLCLRPQANTADIF